MESINMAMIEKAGIVAICIGLSYMIVKHICSYLKIEKEPVTILITAATAGGIGYSLAPMIAKGQVLGDDQPVILHLLGHFDNELIKALHMELLDSAFPLLQGVVATRDVEEACKGVDIAIMLDEFPPTMEGISAKNVGFYKAYASALHKHGSDDCKVVVVGNLANTNSLILKDFAPLFPTKNITFLTRLDHNRALGRISERLGVHVSNVKNVVVWGNHSSTLYPDATHAFVTTNSGQRPILELMDTSDHRSWLNGEFMEAVQQRSAAVIKARMLPVAFSVASAICDHIHDWILGTPKGAWVSMGVCSDGSYGVEQGLFYSFPVACHKGEWSIVQGLKINEFSRKKMDETMKERDQEREVAFACLAGL